jgi:hypothetical protein
MSVGREDGVKAWVGAPETTTYMSSLRCFLFGIEAAATGLNSIPTTTTTTTMTTMTTTTTSIDDDSRWSTPIIPQSVRLEGGVNLMLASSRGTSGSVAMAETNSSSV